MQDEQFESWLRDNARSYNDPPLPDVEGMWKEIERRQFETAAPVRRWHTAGWLKIAAALVIGVGLGRVSLTSPASPTTVPSSTAVASADTLSSSHVRGAYTALPALNAPEASKYLGETVALLASLQSDHNASSDKDLVGGAADLLNTTRFLLDAPTTTDPNVRGLLEDLELVLAQIVQMPKNGNSADVESIHQAIEQRDVMPRLRTAVANNYSAE